MKLESNQAIKVLEVDPKDGSLRSCHGGKFQWNPPTLKDDGTWKPGRWTPPLDPDLCYRGYHLTDDPVGWWTGPNLRAFFVEYKGKVDSPCHWSSGSPWRSDHKIAVESCRLLRPLTAKELADYNIFTKGRHVFSGKECVVMGNATVEVEDCDVLALENSKVVARGESRVKAHGNSRITSWGHSVVRSFDNVAVHAHGNSFAIAKMQSKVTLYGHAEFATGENFEGVIKRARAKRK
jgi:hypothetical protein